LTMNLINQFKPLTLAALILTTACTSLQTGEQLPSFSAPSPNLATVYLYRTHDSPGGAVGIDLKDNGIDIGTLQDGNLFHLSRKPGPAPVYRDERYGFYPES